MLITYRYQSAVSTDTKVFMKPRLDGVFTDTIMSRLSSENETLIIAG
jgi:hypothetical protein